MAAPEQIARLRIGLREIEPEIWRRVDVPLGMSLKGLHDVIQAVFGWEDDHLFEFRIGGKAYGIPAPDEDFGEPALNAKSAKLEMLVRKGVRELDYIYDFGDNWRHVVRIEDVRRAEDGSMYPRYVAGARRGPPEDVGSVPGYYAFLKAVRNPRHREHRRMIDWYGGPYDPDEIGLRELDRRLGAIAQRRHTGRLAAQRRVPKA